MAKVAGTASIYQDTSLLTFLLLTQSNDHSKYFLMILTKVCPVLLTVHNTLNLHTLQILTSMNLIRSRLHYSIWLMLLPLPFQIRGVPQVTG